jgi:hypothetical protein
MSNVICVVTSSKAFKDLLAKSGYSEGTLNSIVYEYLNNRQYQEAGRAWPSDEYVRNYFIRKFVGSPAQVNVWGKRYNSPHVYSSYQEAKAAKEEAMTWFNDSDVYIYENNDHSWTMRVSRPLDAKEINKQSKAWLRDIQNTVNELINSGVSGRYIQTGNKIHDNKTQPALNSLGKILDNFFLRRGLKVQAKWSKARQKWIVSYADEEKPFIDDWDDVNDTNYIWNEGQQNAINTVVDFLNDHRPGAGQFIRINGKAGTGKALPVDTIIPTPDGFRRFGDIAVGDYVYDRHGQPTKVTGVFPQGVIDSYTVVLSDGRKVRCNDEHIWSCYTSRGNLKDFTLRQISYQQLEEYMMENEEWLQ